MQVGGITGGSFDPQLGLRAGDIGAEMTALAVQSGLQSEATQSEIEQSEEQAAASESNQQVQAMRANADEVRAAGIIDGCVGVTAGALQGATAALDVAAAGPGAGSAASSLRAEGEWFKAASSGLQGGDRLVDALAQGSELSDDATAKADGDAADRATQAAKDAHDAAGADQAAVSAAIQTAGQTEQAEASANLAIAQRV